jgi:hypothetical protein
LEAVAIILRSFSYTMPNRLAHETSPYLQQHAGNPVDWYAWGEEALQAARAQDKPILLSIGYSACHWCHVMAHESFEDADVAAVMNRHFINIKVDREERPDLDQIYQLAHQMISQRSGGWPLTMFLTPEQEPFFGGTYFPKSSRYGLPGFPDLLLRVAQFYQSDRRARRTARNSPLPPLTWPSRIWRRVLTRVSAVSARRPSSRIRPTSIYACGAMPRAASNDAQAASTKSQAASTKAQAEYMKTPAASAKTPAAATGQRRSTRSTWRSTP